MSEIKEVIITAVEPVIAETESVASEVDEELVARMSENYEDLEVYEEPYFYNKDVLGPSGPDGVETDQKWLNAPESIKKGIYFNTFGGGPEGGFFVVQESDNPLIEPGQIYHLERTWGQKFNWSYDDRQLERRLFQSEYTFQKDGRPHIRLWKQCPPPRFVQMIAGGFIDTACSPAGQKKLILPFYQMGAPGHRSCITGAASLQRPKKIDLPFLLRVADKLEKNPSSDWDWNAFRRNLITPNFNHIQIHHRITSPKVMSRWTEDLFVFLNNAYEKDTVVKKRGQPDKIHLAPSINNLNNPADIDY